MTRSLENWLLWAVLLWFVHTRSSVDAFAAVTWGVGSDSYARGDQLQSKELRFQLEKIQKDGASLSFRHVKPTERQEIEMLTRNLVKFHGSPIPLDEMDEYLPGSSWRLAFSTKEEIVNQLPSVDASIHLKFKGSKKNDFNNNDDKDDDSSPPHVDYMIKFHKNRMGSLSGVDTLKMGCSWQAAAGLVVFEDDDEDDNNADQIMKGNAATGRVPLTVLEDIHNRNVGRKGLFIGRSRFIKTTYFDGDVWIECGKSGGPDNNNNNNCKSFTNIYLRENREQHFEYSI